MPELKRLFEMFPPVTTEEWMEKVRTDLKGADFNKKLVWKPYDGIEIMPFYRKEETDQLLYAGVLPGEYPYIRGNKVTGNNWKIRQDITVTDYSASNNKALDLLMKGVDSLGFIISDPETINKANFEKLLHDISPEAVELNFFSNGKAIEISDIFRNSISIRDANPEMISGAIETDPIGRLVLQGTLCIPPEKGFDYLYSLTSSLKELPAFRAIHCNASNFYNAGADMVQELAFSISMGAEYIAQLTSRGMDPGYAASKIRFSFGTGSHYFPEIAKLRAARLLWSAVMNGFIPGNTDAAKMVIHSVTGRWNKTIFDPYVNLLRTQTEAMSSVTGGADSITVEPFDKVFRQPDDFSERIARNQQLILKEESCFDRVADPASGSYYIENLTHNLADKAWKLFIETEEEGGFLEALRKGSVQQMIRKTAEIKRSDISKRKTIFLGTNKYPAGEPLPQMSDPERLSGENLITDENIIEPLQLFRGPEIFEQLRMDVEEAARRPVVFLIPVGDPVMRKARAKFSSEFFGCAGYRVIEVRDFNTSEEGAREAVDSGADIVVICSSDEEYSVYGPEISGILRNKAIIVIAGNPASADDLKNEGIEHFISLKSDTAATLRDFNVRLGVNMGI